MQNILTFIIPVRHPDNARDWLRLKQALAQTIGSIAAQEGDGWKAVIVANHGADLPPLPHGCEVKWVAFAPNAHHEQGNADKEQFLSAFRIDKGRRVLAGMLHAPDAGHFMIVDDDDFVSRKLTSFVARNSNGNGWIIHDGYVWSEGSRFLYLHPDFSSLCGSSHIIRADLYKLPAHFDAACDSDIARLLGSHRFIQRHLDTEGTPLAPLPFPGAIYRVGHSQSHSRTPGVAEFFFPNQILVRHPVGFARRLLRLRRLKKGLRTEFFGERQIR